MKALQTKVREIQIATSGFFETVCNLFGGILRFQQSSLRDQSRVRA